MSRIFFLYGCELCYFIAKKIRVDMRKVTVFLIMILSVM